MTNNKCWRCDNIGVVAGTAGKGVGHIMQCTTCGCRWHRYYAKDDPQRDESAIAPYYNPNWEPDTTTLGIHTNDMATSEPVYAFDFVAPTKKVTKP